MPLQQKVLVVDDDAQTRNLLTSLLRRQGLAVDEASDGEEAITLLSRSHYAVVLLDLFMPRINGDEVVRNLATLDGHQPIVLLVTGARDHVLSEIDTRHIHGIIRKPFDGEEIAALVKSCVEIDLTKAIETMCVGFLATTPLIFGVS